jgi:hypothetical protein
MLTRHVVIFLLVATLSHLRPAPADAHSGGTNAQGCHTNHRTGDYHCHTPKYSAPAADTYCHVIDGEQRCGYARSTCSNLAARYGGYCVRE